MSTADPAPHQSQGVRKYRRAGVSTRPPRTPSVKKADGVLRHHAQTDACANRRISVLTCTFESSDVRHHQYLCGCEQVREVPEVDTLVGEIPNRPFQLSFNASRKIDFQGSRVTSGLILVRELDERLGFGAIDPTAPDRLTSWQEHAVPFRRPGAAIGL